MCSTRLRGLWLREKNHQCVQYQTVMPAQTGNWGATSLGSLVVLRFQSGVNCFHHSPYIVEIRPLSCSNRLENFTGIELSHSLDATITNFHQKAPL